MHLVTEGTREGFDAAEVKAQVGDTGHDRALRECLCYGLFCVQQLKKKKKK